MHTLRMLLEEKKSSTITSVAPTMAVSAAVQTMNEAKVGAAIVLERRELVGILTERDIMVRVVGEGRDPQRTTVSEVMTSSVYTATPTTLIREAMRVMAARNYRHLPVMENNTVRGLISMGELASWTMREQANQVDLAIGAVKRMGYSNRRGVDSAAFITGRPTGAVYLMGVLVVVAFIALMVNGVVSVREAEGAGPTTSVSLTTATRFDPQRFILNGLLVPALDTDAMPLRWVDPRPAIQCRPEASVRVDGAPLVPGDAVPDAPFELEWHADGCRPFGAAGPRFDGDVKLTVVREDWGFSAFVAPRGLRITTPWHPSTAAHPGAAAMPQSVPEGELLLGQ